MSFPSRVDRPVFSPHKCVVLGKGDDARGWLDLGNIRTSQPDPRGYISHGGVLTAARLFGYDIPALLETRERVGQLEAELAEARAELERAERFKGAIHILEAEGLRARRKPGPKPKEKAHG